MLHGGHSLSEYPRRVLPSKTDAVSCRHGKLWCKGPEEEQDDWNGYGRGGGQGARAQCHSMNDNRAMHDHTDSRAASSCGENYHRFGYHFSLCLSPRPRTMLIPDSVFYITGGSSGLGLATVQHFHQLGAYIAILDVQEGPGQALASSLGARAVFARCDVRSEEDVSAAIEVVQSKWGGKRVGGLVHCGGVGMVGKTVGSDGSPFDLSTFKDVIDINLTGTFVIASHIAALIARTTTPPSNPATRPPGTLPAQEDDRGVLIFTSSVSYEEGQMGQVAYASSKAGVVGMVLPMARDLSRYGIRVAAIAPSLFSTAMGANSSAK